MNHIKISVTSGSFSSNPQLVEELKSHFSNLKINSSRKKFSKKELIEFLKDSDGAIIGLDHIDKEIIDQLPSLKIVSKYGVGLDNIDQNYLNQKSIAVGWTGGVNKSSVSELTLAQMITLSRNLNYTSNLLKEGKWLKNGGRELSELTIGIIGIGHIGQDLIKKLQPFNTTILANDIVDKSDFLKDFNLVQVSKEELFTKSDIITIHTPKTNLTTNLLDKTNISKLNEGAIVICTARGGIVNEEALYSALKKNSLHGAALDVFETEPATSNKLLKLDNFIGTPHISGNSNKAVLSMGQEAIKHLTHFFKDKK